MLTLQDIPRRKAGAVALADYTPSDALGQERLKLATRAKDLLGYSTLAEDVTGQKAIGVKEGKLTATLITLGYDVLDTEAVLRYQMEEAGRRTLEAASRDLKNWTGFQWGLTPAKWSASDMKSYSEPIPEFVLDKAIRIKEALPEVEFRVQHLDDPKADPFLIARLGDEIYYVEAWAEPRFERGL